MFNYLKKITHYNYFRRKLHLFCLRHRIRNKDFTIVASNCVGGGIYHDLGQRFNSPFINLKFNAADFIALLKDFDQYMKCELKPINDANTTYPKGDLGG